MWFSGQEEHNKAIAAADKWEKRFKDTKGWHAWVFYEWGEQI